MLLPMMLRELGGALASMADGPHDERRNSLELLNNILEVLSRHNVVRRNTAKASAAQTALWVIASKGTEGTKAHIGGVTAQASRRE